MEVALIVIRTSDMDRLVKFYSLLGLKFEYHKHGNSPYHYSTKADKTILEIYPLSKSQTEPDQSLRLGFRIENFEEVLNKLHQEISGSVTEPIETEWGIMAIITDPDGRKIELNKNKITGSNILYI